MIYIRKSHKIEGGYFVSVTGKNGEKLCTTETVQTKQSAWKNVFAQAENFKTNTDFQVSDESTLVSNLYLVTRSGGKYTKEKYPF